MKTKMLFVMMLFIGINLNAQTTFEKIIKALAGLSGSLKNVTTRVVEVNSSSNAHMLNGKTRQAIQVVLPAGTKKWYYRITVLDVKSNYSYQSNESFYYLLQNNKSMETYAPMKDGIDFYLLGHSGEVDSFLKTGNNNFNFLYANTNTNSFIGESTTIQDNLWIGIKNPNTFQGLKVIVEVVAWGNYF